MRKKIIHLITGLQPGGAELSLVKLLPRIASEFDQLVCCWRDRGIVGEKLARAGVRVVYLDARGLTDRGASHKFTTIVQSWQPRVLVTYLPHADLFGRWMGWQLKIPTIVCSIRVKPEPTLRGYAATLLDRLSSGLVNYYHFNSRAVADYYERRWLFPRSKAIIIPNGLRVADYQITGDKATLRRELKIASDQLVVGCVARLRKQKGHQVLLNAWSAVIKEFPRAVLLLVGDGPEGENIARTIKNYGLERSVRCLGRRQDIPQLLQITNVFVLATWYEGMCNSLLEAMAAGRAIVTTDIAENRELIQGGQSGILVQAGKSGVLARAMIRLLGSADLRGQLGRAAEAKAAAKYDLDLIIKQYRNFYERI